MENTIENQPKKTWFKKIIIITLCLLLLLFCYTRFWIHKWITIKEYPIIEETLPSNWNGLKIVHFSDIHFGKTTNETEVEKAILFGSYAKNTPTKFSDIDILIDSNGKIKGLKFFAIIDTIREKFDKDVDVIEKSEVNKNSKIEKEIEETGVVVYEK